MTATPATRAPESRGSDISRLVGLHTRGAQLILGVFMISNVLFAVSTADRLDHVWASYLAVVLVGLGGVIVTRPHPDPFSSALTFAVLAIVLVSTALVSYALPDTGSLGRATWHLGANTWLLWFLIMRRRITRAWLGGAGMLVITMVWTELAGRGALAGLLLASPQILLLLIATLFGGALRRSAARISALSQRSVDAAAASSAMEAARRIQDQRAEELAQAAVPVLTRIASGEELTDETRRELVRIEAQLRDSVRGRSLATPTIVDAATRARERGVDVTLLDDRGEPAPSHEHMSAVVSAVERALDAAHSGSVTVRLLPAGRPESLTIVSQADDATHQFSLPSVASR